MNTTNQSLLRLFPWAVVLVLGLLLIRACTKDPQSSVTTHHTLLEQVESLGKLELVRYKFKDIVEHEQIRAWMPDPRALLVVSGEAVGCIDLSKVKKEDILVKDSVLHIRLPAPELCYYKIDHSKSKVYKTEYALWSEAQLVDEAYRKAESQIATNALNAGILDETKTNARKFLSPLFAGLGYKQVVYEFK